MRQPPGLAPAGAPRTERAGGRYALYAEIASGGMATVHIARFTGPKGFARTVAIKKLHPQFARDPEFSAMFLDEARLVARIRHPNVVPTLDVVSEGDELFLVMEYVAGETLSRIGKAVHAAGQRIDPRIAAAIVANVLHGLHAAHEAKNEFGEPLGIVHRDVSPQNILVGADGVARVVDFGVAKALGHFKETPGAQLKGKIAYMAPEQFQGTQVTRRTDVFAAGIVLWESLAGRRLFDDANKIELMKKIWSAPIEPPSALAPGIPPEVDRIVLRALDRDPNKRFTTAREMALAVERAIAPAMPSEIGEWVEAWAGRPIAARAERIRAMESSSTSEPEGPQIISSSEFVHDYLWGPGKRSSAPPRTDAEELPPSVARPASVAPPRTPAPTPPRRSSGAPRPAEPESPREDAVAVATADLVRASARPSGPVPEEEPHWAPLARRWSKRAFVFALLALALLGAGALTLPGYARQRAVAMAAAEGVELSIDAIGIGAGSVRLRGITARVVDAPGAKLAAASADVELTWLEPTVATLRGVEVTVEGPAADTMAALEVWYAAHHGAPPAVSAGTPLRIDVPAAHLAWEHAFAGEGRVEASEITGQIAPKSSPRTGDEFHFTSKRVTLTTGTASVGPWRVDFDRETTGSRAHVAFDAAVPDGPSALLVRGTAGDLSADVKIPRVPLYRLGIPPALAETVPEAPAQMEALVHYTRGRPDRAQASLDVSFFGATIPPMVAPVDVKIGGSITGDPRGPLDLRDGQLSIGPVRATLTGPVTLSDHRVRAALSWKAAGVPCADLLPSKTQAAGDLTHQLGSGADLGSVAFDLGALAQSTGVVHVSGTLSASGTFTFDSADVGKTELTAVAKNGCGLSLFRK